MPYYALGGWGRAPLYVCLLLHRPVTRRTPNRNKYVADYSFPRASSHREVDSVARAQYCRRIGVFCCTLLRHCVVSAHRGHAGARARYCLVPLAFVAREGLQLPA